MGGLLAHFGLGDAANVDLIRIEWPSGNVQDVANAWPDRLLTLTEQTFITPARPSAGLNGSVTLSRTTVSGATYQWRFNGVDLASETARILVLTNIVADQEGRYSVVVSNATTLVTNYAYLHVDTNFTVITEGRIVTDRESSWGCNWIDYDDDGNVDLFVCNGAEATGLERNALYHNEVLPDGSHVFTRTTTNEVGPIVGDLGKGYAAAWGDYDNDGWLDMFLGSGFPGTNTLYHNERNGKFSLVTQGPVVKDRFSDAEAAAWGDYDGDGLLDLVVSDYPSLCRVYRNQGNGVFERVAPGGLGDLGNNTQSALTPAWADYDNDSHLDLFFSSYNATNRLFHNKPSHAT